MVLDLDWRDLSTRSLSYTHQVHCKNQLQPSEFRELLYVQASQLVTVVLASCHELVLVPKAMCVAKACETNVCLRSCQNTLQHSKRYCRQNSNLTQHANTLPALF